ELRGRLVVPTAPSAPAVDAQGCALIACEQDDLRVLRVDPDGVIVVAAGRAFEGVISHTAIGRTIRRGVAGIDNVFVARVNFHFSEVAPTSPDAHLRVDARPTFARIVRA